MMQQILTQTEHRTHTLYNISSSKGIHPEEYDRLSRKAIAHLKLKGAMPPLRLCRAIGLPVTVHSKTSSKPCFDFQRLIRAMEAEGLIEVIPPSRLYPYIRIYLSQGGDAA